MRDSAEVRSFGGLAATLALEADISDNSKAICPSCQELSAQDSENRIMRQKYATASNGNRTLIKTAKGFGQPFTMRKTAT